MSRQRSSFSGMRASGPASVAASYPVIQQVAAAHDGKGDDKTPPYIPKENLVLCQTSVPTSAFGGAGTAQYQIEFVVPKHLGKVVDAQINFQLEFVNPGDTTVSVMPTTFFCDAIETLYNGQVVERVEREEIHQETVQYLTDQELNQIADRLNIDSSTGGLNTFQFNASCTKSFWLPLWACAFGSAQPYVRGFSGEWRFRLFLTPNIWATADGASSGGTVAVKNIYLYCTEAQLQPGVESALNNAHASGCLYRSVIRNKWTKGESQLVAGQEYQQTLTAFNTDSAALNLYVKPNASVPRQYIQKLELGDKDDVTSYIQIRDAANGELTIQLPPNDVVNKTNLFVPFPSVYKNVTMLTNTGSGNLVTGANPAAGSIQKFYLFPFCPSIQKVLDEGHVGGGYLLTGQERIVIKPQTTLNNALTSTGSCAVVGTATGVQVCCVSYEYAKLSCQGGQLVVRRTV